MSELEMTAVKAAPKAERKRTKKVFASLAAVTLVGVAGVAGTTAALSATTANEGNEFDAGYLTLADNDSNSYMYNLDNQEPGDFVERCITISSTGTADATLALSTEGPGALGALADDLLLTIDQGTQPAADSLFRKADENNDVDANDTCTRFALVENLWDPTADGTLADFKTAHGTDTTGVEQTAPLVPGSPVVYRIRVQLDPAAVPSATDYLSGVHTYTWRAATA